MDLHRAAIESLLGVNRNGDKPELEATSFDHPNCCKGYICGLCPGDLFAGTKADVPACAQQHKPALRQAYEQQAGAVDHGYEQQLEADLYRILTDARRRAERELYRLGRTFEGAAPVLRFDDLPECAELDRRIAQALADARRLGAEGQVFEAQARIRWTEALRARKNELQAAALMASVDPRELAPGVDKSRLQKSRICDVCAATLSIYDTPERLAEHFRAPRHQAYLRVRGKIGELRELRARQRAAPAAAAAAAAADVSPGRRSHSNSHSHSHSRGRSPPPRRSGSHRSRSPPPRRRSRSPRRRSRSPRRHSRDRRRRSRSRSPRRRSRDRSRSRSCSLERARRKRKHKHKKRRSRRSRSRS